MSEADPVVTVVIPYSPDYTPRKMLDEAIESVKKQDIETEILVQCDLGVAKARNVGMKMSETRYVAFLDADDLWKRSKLAKQLDELKSTDSSICIEGADEDCSNFLERTLSGEISSATSSILIDTDSVSCEFEERLNRQEDHLFMIEATSEGGICCCSDLIEVRKHSEGLSSREDIDMKLRGAFEFFVLAVDRVPESEQYRNSYFSHVYHNHGRRHHKRQNYRNAVRSFVISLAHKPRPKTVLALLLSAFVGFTTWLRNLV